jgi:DNA-binding response OmpR family regulator
MQRNILLVEDEEQLGRVLQQHLQHSGFDAQLAATGAAGLRAAERSPFDLVLLDLMLPDIDGFEVCRRLRIRNACVPIVMLTARSSEVDRVRGLETGADDYLSKPFSLAELTARIKAMFRRVDAVAAMQKAPAAPVTISDVLCIDPESREVSVRGRRVDLTHKEFDLLWYLAQRAGRVYSRAQLLDAVWGYSHEGYEHAVNCHINRLRAKIEEDPAHPKLIRRSGALATSSVAGCPPRDDVCCEPSTPNCSSFSCFFVAR